MPKFQRSHAESSAKKEGFFSILSLFTEANRAADVNKSEVAMLTLPYSSETTLNTVYLSFQAAESGIWLSCWQDGQVLAEGWMAEQLVSYDVVEHLQFQYQQRLQRIQQWANDRLPIPPSDHSELISFAWSVTSLLPEAIIQQIYQLVWRGTFCNLVLEFDPALQYLLCVPWEIMLVALDANNQQAGFLAVDTRVCLVRQVRGLGLHSSTQFEQTPRLYALAAHPYDQAEITLDVSRDILTQQPAADWYEDNYSLAVLQDWVRRDQPEVLHVLCHGIYTDTGRETAQYELLLTHAQGYTQRVSALELMRVLRLAPSLRAIVLQACHSGELSLRPYNDTVQLVAGVALSLMHMGVPLVVAMQGCISQAAADAFVQGYYEKISTTGNLAWAVQAGRVAMYTAGHQIEWSLPVIYQGQTTTA